MNPWDVLSNNDPGNLTGLTSAPPPGPGLGVDDNFLAMLSKGRKPAVSIDPMQVENKSSAPVIHAPAQSQPNRSILSMLQNSGYDQPQVSDAQRQLLEKMVGTQQDDASAIRQQADTLAARPNQINLAPLAAWADSFGGGSKLASGYTAPMTPEEKQATVAKLRQLAGAQEENAAKTQLGYMGNDEKAQTQLLKAMVLGQQRDINSKAKEDKSHNADLIKAYTDTMNDTNVKKVKGQLSEANTLYGLSEDALNNPESRNAIGVYAARYATGGQRLNKQEIEALGQGSKAIGDQIAQVIQNAQSGTLTHDNYNFMKKFVDVTNQRAKENYQNLVQDKVSGWAKILKTDPQELYDTFGMNDSKLAGGQSDLLRPNFIPQKDWDKATPAEKQKAVNADKAGWRPPGWTGQ